MMIAYSLINVPYASLFGVVFANPIERNTLSSSHLAQHNKKSGANYIYT
jgi:Na+/melibiose symporter-like transporter